MAQRKKMETPRKQPKSSTMTHAEDDEMKHDISILRGQEQHFFLSWKVKESKMEAKIDGIEEKPKNNMDDLKK